MRGTARKIFGVGVKLIEVDELFSIAAAPKKAIR